MAKTLNADLILDKYYQGRKGKLVYMLVQKRLLEKQKIDLRVILLGGSSVGKTTAVFFIFSNFVKMGVLVLGEKDDGAGMIKAKIAKHKHEKYAGFTSSVNEQIIGFDEKGGIMVQNVLSGALGWSEILRESTKIVRFIDVSGMEMYSKTMVFLIEIISESYQEFVVDFRIMQ